MHNTLCEGVDYMSNRFKLKKSKVKEEETEKSKETKDSKHGAKFMKNKQEKGTIASNFAGKSSKEFSRKKT
jgi:hypothetical protein